MTIHPSILPGKSHGRGAWQVSCITRVRHNLAAKPPLTDLGQCFPGGASHKELPANAGDIEDEGLIPWLGRSLGEGHSNPLQYSWLENPWTGEHGGLQCIESRRVRHD